VGGGGKMIMNSQIPLKAKKRECYYLLLREECTIWPVGSKAEIIPLLPGQGLSAPGD